MTKRIDNDVSIFKMNCRRKTRALSNAHVMPPKKKTAETAAPRRSSRVENNEAEAEAKMHAEALAATKDWFAELGKEMQMAEDQEAAELFAQTVMEHEEKTGLVCVMLDSVDDDSDSDDEDEDDDDDDENDSDAEPSEVSGSDDDNNDDENSDSDSEDPMWAPDCLKERLENALKVYVPPAAADALETLQLTLSMAEVVPGAGADLAEKIIDGAERALKENDYDKAFASAFSATVAMLDVDPELTWAADLTIAAKLLSRLAQVWKNLFASSGKKTSGVGKLEKPCVDALTTYLKERCVEKWGEKSEGREYALGLEFEVFGTTSEGKGKKRARD